MLRLHKGYSIPSSLRVTRKLTQRYVRPFQVLEQIGSLAYKLDLPHDWKILTVFLIPQLEPASLTVEDFFGHPRRKYLLFVLVGRDIDAVKSFEIDCLLNKQIIKKGRGQDVEYLVCWTGYGPKWDRWYNIKNFDNTAELVRSYEEDITQWEH